MSTNFNLAIYESYDGFGKNQFVDDDGNNVTLITYIDEDGNRVTKTIKEKEDEFGTHIIQDQITQELTNGQIIEIPAHKRSLAKGLNGNAQTAPTDNGLSSSQKTPEQEANLAKLAGARTYLESENGQALEKLVTDANYTLTRKQKRDLKKQGIDPDAFMQALNEKHSKVRYNAAEAAEKRDDMGALANTFLGERTEEEPLGRQPKRKDTVATNEKRGFFKKLFTQKQKQYVQDSQKYVQEGGTKVKIHSATEEAGRNSNLQMDISDESARAGSEYLDAFKDGYKGNKREKFTEIDENGNKTKVKVNYNKDGSVRKVVTKSKVNGKLKVKENKDGHITIKGDLQSHNLMEGPSTRVVQGSLSESTSHSEYHMEHCPDNNVEPPKPPTPPTPPTPPVPPVPPTPVPVPPVPPTPPVQIEDKPGGLIQDIVNGVKTSGIGQVTGEKVRAEFKKYGAKAMVKAYCSYDDATAPKDAKKHAMSNEQVIRFERTDGDYKKLKVKNSGFYANKMNAEHLAQALINDTETGKPDEKALGEFIEALRKNGKTSELKAVKAAIIRHNQSMQKSSHLHSEATRTNTALVTNKNLAINWLMSAKNL